MILATCVLLKVSTQIANADLNPSKSALAYRKYREALTQPTYGLKKVKALISKIKLGPDNELELDAKSYQSLSFKERFTFNLIHGEAYSQNCDAMPIFEKEAERIFGHIPGPLADERSWSERQRAFFTENRAETLKLLKETIKIRKRAGANIKNLILELNAVELIPDLISVYKVKRVDHDVLTTLNLLMLENKFQPFISSTTYQKLYGPQSNYLGFIEANKANQELVISRAKAFFESRKK